MGALSSAARPKDPATQKNDLLVAKRVPGSGWLWTETLGGAGSDWGSSMVQSQPGCFVIAGHTESFGAGGFDGWIVKMCDAVAAVPVPGDGEGGAARTERPDLRQVRSLRE